MSTRLALATLLLLVAGCEVGPDYKTPETPTPTAYEGVLQEGVSADPVVQEWWRGFNDPILDELLKRALAGNRPLRAAEAAIREARALKGEVTFNLAPIVTSHASYTRQLEAQALLPGVPRSERTFAFWNPGFDATWEIDLFGRVRRSIEAASAEVEVAEASWRDVQVSLLAEVARTYFEGKGARYRLDVARRNAVNQEATLKYTVSRFEGGRGTELDVAQARADLESTRAIIPPIEAEAIQAKNRLATLLGVPASNFSFVLPEPATPGRIPPLVAVGTPEDLLRRRPDIRAAERRLAATTALIGVATADLFPRLTFNGTFGPQATSIPALFQAGSAAYLFGPTLTWAAFDLGRVNERIKAADARAEADLARYEETVLEALEDTENALAQFGRNRSREAALVDAVAAAQRATSLANDRFQGGAADFLAVLVAQRTALSLELQLADVRTQTVLSLIAVYKALGGGWRSE
jgi:multidrug efflux system outer membrane protein